MRAGLLLGLVGACAKRAPPPELPDLPRPVERILIEVGHRRELRGGWIATVDNINWPSEPGLSADAQRQELDALLDASADAGLNAIFFQVRPEGDALYRSALEPWSRYLSGTQGEDPGYDPLQLAIEGCHTRGMELHAWFNPYRAGLRRGDPVVDEHVAVRLADHVYAYGEHRWMDPGAPEVQDHTAAVIADVVRRYDIDGVHFDDYFYPYPTRSPFPDRPTWEAHADGLPLADWRRSNVDRMVRRVSEVVAADKPWVRFGISPFGIYRPEHPPGIKGFDQYAKLYADPPRWRAEGWVDYLAPQLYWPTTKTAQSYEALLGFWAGLPGDGSTFPGNFLAKLGTDGAWTVDEIREQVRLTRADPHAAGNIWFHVGPLLENTDAIRDVFRDEIYATPALPPPVTSMLASGVSPPVTVVEGTTVRVEHPDARWWVVYRPDGEGWAVERIVPATEPSIALSPGRWAVTAAGRHGVESLGVRLDLVGS